MNPLGHKNWNRTISWVVSGVRDFRKSGSGTLTLSAANTFTGGVIVAAGTLSSTAHNSTASASGLGAATNNISIAAGATLELAATGGVTTLTGNISGAGSISQNNGSSFAVSLAGDNSGFSGTYTMQTGCIALSFNSATSGSASATWVLNGNTGSPRIGARYGSAAQAWLPGLTTGTSNTIKLGSVSTTSTTIQIGNNTSQASQTGETTWEIGELNASTTFAGVVVDTIVGSTAFTSSKVHVKKVGTGTLTLTGTNTYTGVTTFDGGVVSCATLSNGGNNSNIGAATSAASNLVFGGGTLRHTGGAVGVNRAFTVNTGGATIDSSGSGAVTWSGAPTFATSATLTLTGSFAGSSFSAVIGGGANGNLVKSGSGTWSLTAANTYTGSTAVSAGTLTLGGSVAHTVQALDIASGATLTSSTSSGSTISGALTGSGAINTSSAYFDFGGDCTAFAGSVTVTAGTSSILSANGGSALADYTFSGTGTIALWNGGGTPSFSVNLGSLTGSGTGVFKAADTGVSGTLTAVIGAKNSNTTISSVIRNSLHATPTLLAITKVGTGTLTFSGANTYTGLTQISVGTLNWSGSAVSNSVRIDVSNASPTTSNSGKMITSGALALSGKTINAVVTETGTFNYEFADNAAATDGTPTWQINGSNVVSGIANGNGTTLTYDSVTGNGTISR